MEKHIVANANELATEFAEWLIHYIDRVLTKQDRFTLVLSGGSTPRKLYELLATEPYQSKIDWKRLHFFWGDERFVPFTDERNNARMAYNTLLNHVPIVHDQIHVMRTDLPADEASVAYEEILHQYFGTSGPSFDLVLLGLGDNSHTLSLFPGYPVVHEAEKWVTAFYLEEQQMYRITLTAPIVNRSASIAYLVSGADKAPAVKAVISGTPDPDLHPAQVIHPTAGGTVHWFLDQPASAEL
ncbi:MAG: 6-phosphogluconolactonase [Sphingobacteriales bacterium]|nr:6-phosphogluconolactonase [Sphingobacteriales bacterium]NCT74533.1 6-phosphogluconolactonase [Chitinophagaceae bacterium]OJW32425.1 MAG: 6-phosphogluconolactonase [Sphingobacteriales bacterium 46-32]